MRVKKAFYITTKYHGSNKQLESLANEMYPEYQPIPCSICLRSNSVVLRPFYWLIYLICHFFKVRLFFAKQLFLKGDVCFPGNQDVIIAKTAPCEFTSLLLKSGSGAKLVFMGQPKRIRRKDVDVLISTPSTPVDKADVFFDTLPVSFFSRNEACFFDRSRYFSVGFMIGGDARGYVYSESDWGAISSLVMEFCKNGNDVYIVTSPRTTEVVEHLLRKKIGDDERVNFCFWNAVKKVSVEEVLGKIDLAIVTEDSASMLSEVISSRIPTVSFRPSIYSYNSLVTPLAEYHESKETIIRVDSGDLNSSVIEEWCVRVFKPISKTWNQKWYDFWF